MMLQLPGNEPFFTNNVEGWLKLLGFVGAIAATVWATLKARVAQDINLRRDIDGVGGRASTLESDRTAHATKLQALESAAHESRTTIAALSGRISGVEEAQRSIEKIVREGSDNIAQKVAEIRDAVTGEQARMRERIVRLETISELRRMGLLKDEERS